MTRRDAVLKTAAFAAATATAAPQSLNWISARDLAISARGVRRTDEHSADLGHPGEEFGHRLRDCRVADPCVSSEYDLPLFATGRAPESLREHCITVIGLAADRAELGAVRNTEHAREHRQPDDQDHPDPDHLSWAPEAEAAQPGEETFTNGDCSGFVHPEIIYYLRAEPSARSR